MVDEQNILEEWRKLFTSGATSGAGITGIAVSRRLTVHRLGKNFGAAGLAGTPGAREQVSVGGASLLHLLAQGLGDMILTHYVRKHFGPPFAVEGLIHQITLFFVKN